MSFLNQLPGLRQLHRLRAVANEIVMYQHDILASHALAPLARSFLPFSPSSMRPAGVLAVLTEISINQRKCIIECGSGVSTLYIARLLKELGGQLITIEHDAGWLQRIEELLSREGLRDHVRCIHASLKPMKSEVGEVLWYDQSVFGNALQGVAGDLLLVDGPPSFVGGQEFGRFPAVPFCRPFLAPAFTVVLDDINRPAEDQIVRRWEKTLGISSSAVPSEAA